MFQFTKAKSQIFMNSHTTTSMNYVRNDLQNTGYNFKVYYSHKQIVFTKNKSLAAKNIEENLLNVYFNIIHTCATLFFSCVFV